MNRPRAREGLPQPQRRRAMLVVLAGLSMSVLDGAIANLIVVQRAAASGVVIGLWDYCRVGVPLTLLTLLIGTFWLST